MLTITRILEEKMKNLRKLLVLSLTIAGFLLAGTAAMADPLTITLSQPFQSGLTNDTLDFYATVTNNSDTKTVYLNGDGFSVDAPLVLDDSAYLSGFPLTLAPDASYTGLLFTIYIPSLTTMGLYEGEFEITGGHYNSGEEYTLGSADFDVYVTPEPSSLSLLGMGLLTGLVGLGGTLRRRRMAGRMI
jgi:hypothetical protein